MTINYKGTTFKSGKWHKVNYAIVKNRNNQFYNYCKDNDCDTVDYFNIYGVRVGTHELYSRCGCMGFDFKAEHYPPCINCYTDKVGSYLEGTLCELDSSGERLRIWKEC